jgi:uncharacterized repeat protein (TIGR01451 family)
MKKILSILLLLGALSVLPTKAFADCQPIYGGGETCTSFNFTINKLVQVPGKGGGNFVDNLSINDPRYSPSQTINYQLIVTNTGNETIPTLNIKDNFPQYVNFVSGGGSYDSNSKTLSFTINNLGAGKSQTFNLQTKTADSKTVPAGITCVVNQASADDTHGDTDADSSQACIQNSTAVLPAATVKTTPATGPELIPLALLFPGALGGLFLRRKSKKLSFEGGEK